MMTLGKSTDLVHARLYIIHSDSDKQSEKNKKLYTLVRNFAKC